MTTTATEAKKPPENPLAQVAHGLEIRREQFRAMLPNHIPAERFERVVMTAVNMDPDLLTADRRSFYNACMRAASDGLLPDKREGALVPFKDEKSGKRMVVWMPMVFGLLTKIRQSGAVDSIGARIVYQNEIIEKRFSFVVSDGVDKLYHEPMLWGDRGPKVLVYAYARFKDSGTVEYVTIHKDDVLKRRKAARTDKVWSAWEDEMWMKTAIRAIANKLPLSSDLRIDREEPDDEPSEFDKMRASALTALAAPVDEDGVVIDVESQQQEPVVQQQPSQVEVVPGQEELFQQPQAMPDGPGLGDARKEITPEEFIKNATEGLTNPEFNTPQEVEEYAQRMRVNLMSMKQPLEDRRRQLSQFNRAVVERTTAMLPKART
jgi:recombination protein RecT